MVGSGARRSRHLWFVVVIGAALLSCRDGDDESGDDGHTATLTRVCIRDVAVGPSEPHDVCADLLPEVQLAQVEVQALFPDASRDELDGIEQVAQVRCGENVVTVAAVKPMKPGVITPLASESGRIAKTNAAAVESSCGSSSALKIPDRKGAAFGLLGAAGSEYPSAADITCKEGPDGTDPYAMTPEEYRQWFKDLHKESSTELYIKAVLEVPQNIFAAVGDADFYYLVDDGWIADLIFDWKTADAKAAEEDADAYTEAAWEDAEEASEAAISAEQAVKTADNDPTVAEYARQANEAASKSAKHASSASVAAEVAHGTDDVDRKQAEGGQGPRTGEEGQ